MAIRSNPFTPMKYRDFWLLLSSVLLLTGLSVAILISKWSRLIGVFLFVVGAGILYYIIHAGQPTLLRKQGLFFPMDEHGRIPIISERFINRYTFNGKYPQLMPITAIIIAAGVILYNILFQFNTYLGSNDYVMLLLAASIGTYNYIPKKYSVERDFFLMFLFLLFIIIVIPTTYYSMRYGTTSGGWETENPDSPIIHYLLAKPLAFILDNFFSIHDAVADGVMIKYHADDGQRIEISIALGCTGLYSAAIFLSAFTSYIFVEYRQFDKKVLTLLTLGIITSYVANLLRMTIILLVGYYYGKDALLTTHENIGEFIFMFWIIIFWGLMFRYLDIRLPWDEENQPNKGNTESQKSL